MKRLAFYKLTPQIVQILDDGLHKFESRYKIKLAAVTNHGFDRLSERQISERQKAVLSQSQLRRIAFKKEQISEVRVLELNNRRFVVSIVVDDVVIGVHPRNLPQEARNHGFGTREGELFGVIKTVLSRPNVSSGRKMVDEWVVMG